MSSTIIINSTHFETSSGNRFVYRFPTNMKFAKGQSVALQSISINNTFYNIESSRNNNQMSIIWNADTTLRHDFIIPDGFYTISLLNQFLQKQCKSRNLYFTNADGDINYLINIHLYLHCGVFTIAFCRKCSKRGI